MAHLHKSEEQIRQGHVVVKTLDELMAMEKEAFAREGC